MAEDRADHGPDGRADHGPDGRAGDGADGRAGDGADDRVAVHVAVRDCLADLSVRGARGADAPDRSQRASAAGVGTALVLVACSGGPDSLTLAAVTANTARAHGLRAGAVVVDHGWSQQASAAGARAAQDCRVLGLDPVLLRTVDSSGPGGPEAAARSARYRALEVAATATGAAAVLLGHTLDDQAETVLLGLGRGSGARSLAGMPARRGIFRRPFLAVRRAVVARAGEAMGLRAWHDPANADPAFARVRVRRLAEDLERALGPGTALALARSADLLRADADALDALAEELARSAVCRPAGPQQFRPGRSEVGSELTCDPAAGLLLDPRPLAAALPALRRRALLMLARAAGCPAGSLTHRHASALERLVLTGRGQVALPGDVVAQSGRPEPGSGPRVGLRRRIVAR